MVLQAKFTSPIGEERWFSPMDENLNFNIVSIESGRWLAGSDDNDFDADSLYMKPTGKRWRDFCLLLLKALHMPE